MGAVRGMPGWLTRPRLLMVLAAAIAVAAGAAGTAAAAALREFGFGGSIALIGREPGLPYDRTSLSKFAVSGEMPPDEVPPPLEPPHLNQQKVALAGAGMARPIRLAEPATRRSLLICIKVTLFQNGQIASKRPCALSTQ